MNNATAAVSSLPDVTTFAANFVVFLAALAAVIIGAWKAVQQVRKAVSDTSVDGKDGTSSRVASAVILETTTMLMWSESNRDVCECIQGLKEEITALRHELEIHRAIGKPI